MAQNLRQRAAVPGKTYVGYYALAETGAAVEPVIILELVDFDALSFARRWRSDVCHNRRGRVRVSG